MNLEGIINVAGKPGLYKVVSKGNNTVIVESFTDGKKSPLYSDNQANMLEEIGIYTYDDTKPLSEIFDDIAKKENGEQALNHKSSTNQLTHISIVITILALFDKFESIFFIQVLLFLHAYQYISKVKV